MSNDCNESGMVGLGAARGSTLPAGVRRVVALLEQGRTLHSGHFGMWTMNPIDARCSDVNQHTARALVARKLVRRVEGDRWEATPNGELSNAGGKP